MARRHPVEGPGERYGFTWGQVDVIRLAVLPHAGRMVDGRRILGIQTDHLNLEVTVSDGGHQVTVRDVTVEGQGNAMTVRHG